ncbi:inositol-3-phosphate synthase [Umezawaea tangerina]|uniref:Myo-inositol-1-phosphate synthase n=1 Tax=Umezawaea tangerina TaxID=84725 RepID=A0A2T0SVR3_9PSEU|nr:myo-inositol-1-phosphate synthase [Umezawaea tangerina]PRY37502.1 myo-inositol-1-phosphate synthase [Umezawaea tangerina]
MKKSLRVAIAGVGSCSSSLVQVASLARWSTTPLAGIMHERIGGYGMGDVEFVAAFDVDAGKVGLDLSKAILQSPVVADEHVTVETTGVQVEPGPLLDGLRGPLSEVVTVHPDSADLSPDVVRRRLVETGAEVLVCLLPTGSTEAVQAYARAAALAGAAFINATPEPVAHEPELVALFEERGVPLLGDDLRSHLGATTLHTALLELLHTRGLRVVNTYQLNVGGNTDFLNLADPARSAAKQKSKRRALSAAGIDASTVAAGPNGFVPFLGDHKVGFLRIEATSVLDSQLSLEIRMEVEDSPNAAGVLANAIRVAAAARDGGMAGVVDEVCAFLFKSPRRPATEPVGLGRFQEFVAALG